VDQILQFANNHLGLFAALGAISALLAWTALQGRLQGVKSLSPAEATLLINHQDAVLIDVRDPHELKEGTILNSIHIPIGQFKDSLGKLEKYRDRPVIIACRSGSRSHSACATLARAGFSQVHNLQGGVLAWQNASLPLVRK
jgi:rhodanese-related sulfurtransferase